MTARKPGPLKIIQYCLEHPSNKTNSQLQANQKASKYFSSIMAKNWKSTGSFYILSNQYLLQFAVALLNERILIQLTYLFAVVECTTCEVHRRQLRFRN
jgi:hypothetical protein